MIAKIQVKNHYIPIMKNTLLTIALIAVTSFSFAQAGKLLWKPTVKSPEAVTYSNKQTILSPRLFQLDVAQLRRTLANAPKRFSSAGRAGMVVSFPNASKESVESLFENSYKFTPPSSPIGSLLGHRPMHVR